MKIKSDGKKKVVKKTGKKESVLVKAAKKILPSEPPKSDILKETMPIKAATGELVINKESRAACLIAPTAEPKSVEVPPPPAEPEQKKEQEPEPSKPVSIVHAQKPVLQATPRKVVKATRRKVAVKKNPVFPGKVYVMRPRKFRLV